MKKAKDQLANNPNWVTIIVAIVKSVYDSADLFQDDAIRTRSSLH